jgi:hypothetical protein
VNDSVVWQTAFKDMACRVFETPALGKGPVNQLIDCLTVLSERVFLAGNTVCMVCPT